MSGFPRIYQSFADFEREELRKLDSLNTTMEDMLDERFAEELGMEDELSSRTRRTRRRSGALGG